MDGVSLIFIFLFAVIGVEKNDKTFYVGRDCELSCIVDLVASYVYQESFQNFNIPF